MLHIRSPPSPLKNAHIPSRDARPLLQSRETRARRNAVFCLWREETVTTCSRRILPRRMPGVDMYANCNGRCAIVHVYRSCLHRRRHSAIMQPARVPAMRGSAGTIDAQGLPRAGVSLVRPIANTPRLADAGGTPIWLPCCHTEVRGERGHFHTVDCIRVCTGPGGRKRPLSVALKVAS